MRLRPLFLNRIYAFQIWQCLLREKQSSNGITRYGLLMRLLSKKLRLCEQCLITLNFGNLFIFDCFSSLVICY